MSISKDNYGSTNDSSTYLHTASTNVDVGGAKNSFLSYLARMYLSFSSGGDCGPGFLAINLASQTELANRLPNAVITAK